MKLMKMFGLIGAAIGMTGGATAYAGEVKVGDLAPLFSAKTQDGTTFDLASRKGKGWTVLYFYPKAETPGCTKQACAFRDSIDKIRAAGAEVYGISGDTVEDQAKFHKHHKLAFTLLADPDATIIDKYGAKLPLMKMSKRWTFILDSDLKVRSIDKDVDPALDPGHVVERINSMR